MHASTTPETLPPAATLSRSAQMRWLGIAAGVIVGLVLIVVLIGKLTHHEPAPAPVTQDRCLSRSCARPEGGQHRLWRCPQPEPGVGRLATAASFQAAMSFSRATSLLSSAARWARRARARPFHAVSPVRVAVAALRVPRPVLAPLTRLTTQTRSAPEASSWSAWDAFSAPVRLHRPPRARAHQP